MNQIEEKRSYNHRNYTAEQVSQAISVFLGEGGSIYETQKTLKELWGYSPSEPTIRKWLKSSDEALSLLDQQVLGNLQSDVGNVMALCYDLLIRELQSGNFPASKLGTLYGIMIDKWLLIAKTKSQMNTKASENKDIIPEELNLPIDSEIIDGLLREENIALKG